ncbi:MAG: endo-1,4-beta-xylanase [Candidatus Roseilinea sp.]|nr:MAG: endo-1,4-beta-xylanase [Candidatus Roseilinea sp.]
MKFVFAAYASALILLAACDGLTARATPAAPTATMSAGKTYTNPVYDDDFPDPFVLRVGGTYYAYATNVRSNNVPVLRSTDLATWDRLGDALPVLPKWARSGAGLTWAPSVLPRRGRYVLYFTARDHASDRQCIGRAVADAPEGKFKDDSSQPFICQAQLGGSIDPSPFVDDDGSAWLLWKNDGNCCGLPVGLWIQRLSDDGLSLIGGPRELLRHDRAWEGPLIEGPSMLKHNGKYYLFYSANWYESADYAIGYAVADTIIGPYAKITRDGPLFAKRGEVAGPGGQEFFTDLAGNLWMAYHAWKSRNVGYTNLGRRSLRLDRVRFEGDVPILDGPTTDPQPLP